MGRWGLVRSAAQACSSPRNRARKPETGGAFGFAFFLSNAYALQTDSDGLGKHRAGLAPPRAVSHHRRAQRQNAIPIVNYNDSVSNEENRRFEIAALRKNKGEGEVVDCVDNDETAVVVSQLVGAERLVILTSTEGIYKDPKDASTLIEEVRGSSAEEIDAKIDEMLAYCNGASRVGANGAKAKLTFAKRALENGTNVIIASAAHRLSDIMGGKVRCTRLMID